jgi:hypothetical protein
VVVAIFPAAPAPRRHRQIAGDGGPWRYVARRRLSASGAYTSQATELISVGYSYLFFSSIHIRTQAGYLLFVITTAV